VHEAVASCGDKRNVLVLHRLSDGQGQLTTPSIRAADRATGGALWACAFLEQGVGLAAHATEPETVCLTAIFTDAGLADATLLVA
jgi:hypothetical protein